MKTKSRLSSIDIAGLCSEIAPVIRSSKLTNIYEGQSFNLPNSVIIFKLNTTNNNNDTKFLIIEPGVRFHLTEFISTSNSTSNHRPSPWIMKIRKYIRNQRINNIWQVGCDRVVCISLGGGANHHYIFIEFYARGNFILTSSNGSLFPPRMDTNFINRINQYSTINAGKILLVFRSFHNISESDGVKVGGDFILDQCAMFNLFKFEEFDKIFKTEGMVIDESVISSMEEVDIFSLVEEHFSEIKNICVFVHPNFLTDVSHFSIDNLIATFNQLFHSSPCIIDSNHLHLFIGIIAVCSILFGNAHIIQKIPVNLIIEKNKPINLVFGKTDNIYPLLSINSGIDLLFSFKNIQKNVNLKDSVGYLPVNIIDNIKINEYVMSQDKMNKKKKKKNQQLISLNILNSNQLCQIFNIEEISCSNDCFNQYLILKHSNIENCLIDGVSRIQSFLKKQENIQNKIELFQDHFHEFEALFDELKNGWSKWNENSNNHIDSSIDHRFIKYGLNSDMKNIGMTIIIEEGKDNYLLKLNISRLSDWYDKYQNNKVENKTIENKGQLFDWGNDSEDDEEDEEEKMQNTIENTMDISIDPNKSLYVNLEYLFSEKKKQGDKISKTIGGMSKAITSICSKNREIKYDVINYCKCKQQQDINTLYIEKNKLSSSTSDQFNPNQIRRKKLWFEKFYWFIYDHRYLILAGRDAAQNEQLVRRHLNRKYDIYVHADVHGAPSTIVKNLLNSHDIPLKVIEAAGDFALCRSSAWKSKLVTSAYWVYPDQVSKTAPTGEYLVQGGFMIRGKRHWLKPSRLEMRLSLLFIIDEYQTDRLNVIRDGDQSITIGVSSSDVMDNKEVNYSGTHVTISQNQSRKPQQDQLMNERPIEMNTSKATSTSSRRRENQLKKRLKKKQDKYGDQDEEDHIIRSAILSGGINLSKKERKKLQQNQPNISGNSNVEILCYKCGKNGHLAVDCQIDENKNELIKNNNNNDNENINNLPVNDSEITREPPSTIPNCTILFNKPIDPSFSMSIIDVIPMISPMQIGLLNSSDSIANIMDYSVKLTPGKEKKGKILEQSINLFVKQSGNGAYFTQLVRGLKKDEFIGNMMGDSQVKGFTPSELRKK